MMPALLNFKSSDGTLLSATAIPCVIGRSAACAVRVPSPEVSRRHAVIIRDGRDWWLADCGSKEGTWLNNARIASAARLVSGDFIGIGLTSLRFLPAGDDAGPGSAANHWMETTRPREVEWLVTSDTAVAWVDEHGVISNHTLSAEHCLDPFFGGIKERLPPCLLAWLAGPDASRVPYESKVGDERLRIHHCHGGEGERLLVMSRFKPAFGPESLGRIGLSKAEALLVPWLIRGKRNEEIALIVGVGQKTVEKQVGSILFKLKVETRTAAAWNIIELTGAHG
jgi:DNA-binding CsgD family transcriptional regulator